MNELEKKMHDSIKARNQDWYNAINACKDEVERYFYQLGDRDLINHCWAITSALENLKADRMLDES